MRSRTGEPGYHRPTVATDGELLLAWRGGERAAGEELVARHWASISGFFRAKVGDQAADLIAQTFLACVEGKDRIEGTNVKAYLFSVARRRLADHFRRAAHAPALDCSLTSIADLATGPLSQLVRHQRGELLRAALVRIPIDDQIALELTYVEGLSTREVAQVLEIPENTVRSRLSRAREKLRRVLVELGGADAAALAETQLGPEPVPDSE